MIIQPIQTLKEEGHIDGIIWDCLSEEQLPNKVIKTAKGQTFSQQDIVNHPDIYTIGWAPQFAILQHPSTTLFFGHGGTGSIHEALFSGVRLFIYPFFGDQPGNAKTIERIGIGKSFDTNTLKYNRACYQSFYYKLQAIAADPQHQIEDAVNQYSAYVQVMSVNAISRGADLMEESLFASDKQGQLYYRYDVGYEICWFKRYNLDVYTVLAIVAASFAFATAKVGCLAWKTFQEESKASQKLKSA